MKIKGFCTYILEVALKPLLAFWIAGILMGMIYAATWMRDNVLSKELQDKYATQRYLPQWQWEQWTICFMSLALISIFWNGYKAWRESSEELLALQLSPVPELVLNLSVDGSGNTCGIELKNVSKSDNLHNITIAPTKTPLGEVSWVPSVIPCIQSNGHSTEVIPFFVIDCNKETTYAQEFSTLGNILKHSSEGQPIVNVRFQLYATDARDIYYGFSADLKYLVEPEGWLIGQTKRERLSRVGDSERLRTIRKE